MKIKISKVLVTRVCLFVLVIIGPELMMAQPIGPGNSPTPFGFVEILITGGVALRVRQLIKNRKEDETQLE